MVYREFVVPDDNSILDAIGVSPEWVEGEDAVQILRIPSGTCGMVEFSYDTGGRSIRIRWIRDAETVMDVFRESATRLTVNSGQGKSAIRVDFESDSLAGFLEIQVYPDIQVSDQLLFC